MASVVSQIAESGDESQTEAITPLSRHSGGPWQGAGAPAVIIISPTSCPRSS